MTTVLDPDYSDQSVEECYNVVRYWVYVPLGRYFPTEVAWLPQLQS
jgi:hypothetical protein